MGRHKKIRPEVETKLSQSPTDSSEEKSQPENPSNQLFGKLDEVKDKVEAGEEKKETRGRKSKQEEQDRHAFAKQATFMFHQFGNLINDQFPEEIRHPFSTAENELIDEATSGMAEKYFPLLMQHSTEFSFGLMLLSVFGPRLIDYMAYERKRKNSQSNGGSRNDRGRENNESEGAGARISEKDLSRHE
ncbi:MAG: hypothetical protein JRN15_04880 [Nitrososphaerota archaeon]|nr:hypothetical protein [Nitrososphaerota archaeon]